jgi:hypothetical protein
MVTFNELRIEYLWVIDSGFAYGALIIRNHKCVEAAPIFRHLIGHTTGTLKRILHKKGWSIIKIVRQRL